jgi:surfeit locus 1 family protein
MTAPTGAQPGRRRLWPILLVSTMGVVLLAGLGTWQLQRLAWKQDLLAKIAARTTAPPIDLASAEQRWRETGDVEYVRVGVTGRFAAGRDNYYFTTGPAGPGYHVYAPFLSSDRFFVLVNRGYIPEGLVPAAASGPVPRPAGELTIIGLARSDEAAGIFSGPPPPQGLNRPWLTRDLQGMGGRAITEENVSPRQLVPFFIDQERDAAHPDTYPQGGTTRLAIPNRHLEYALTWYGLAAVLIVMTTMFLRASRRPLSERP